jgi:hypothetical protein
MNLGMPNSTQHDGAYDSLEIEIFMAARRLRPTRFCWFRNGRINTACCPPKSAAEPGRWRTTRTPYLKEIMDKLGTGLGCAADCVHERIAGWRHGMRQ